MFIAYFVAGPWQANCYVVASTEGGRAFAVDVGMTAAQTVEQTLREHHLELAGVLLTHGHVDHCAQAAELADAHGCPVWIHAADRHLLTHPAEGLSGAAGAQLPQLLGGTELVEPHQVEAYDPAAGVDVADLHLDVLPAPGHTPGSVLLGLDTGDARVLFTGDVLFAGSIGRSDLPGGDDTTMRNTLRDVVRELAPRAQVLPGHGPFSTVADELATNPYLTDSYLEVQN